MSASLRYSQPMLIDQLEYLYSNLNRADQLPGQDAYLRFAELEEIAQRLAQEVVEILGSACE